MRGFTETLYSLSDEENPALVWRPGGFFLRLA